MVNPHDENAGSKLGKRGWVVLGVAIVVAALLVAGALIVRAEMVKEPAIADSDLMTVIVSREDIPSVTRLDPFIDRGVFVELDIPATALVMGAITDLDQLRGAATKAAIFANEQIPTARLVTVEHSISGNGLYEGVTYQWCQDRRGFYSPGMTDLPETPRDESTPKCVLWGAGSNEIG